MTSVHEQALHKIMIKCKGIIYIKIVNTSRPPSTIPGIDILAFYARGVPVCMVYDMSRRVWTWKACTQHRKWSIIKASFALLMGHASQCAHVVEVFNYSYRWTDPTAFWIASGP
jgi:hypothetical protein